MSTTAVTNGQCYHQSQETVAIKRAMMKSADRSVLLLDHTKFGKSGLYQLAALTDFDLVIVDNDTPEAEVTALRAQGVHLQPGVVGQRGGTGLLEQRPSLESSILEVAPTSLLGCRVVGRRRPNLEHGSEQPG